MRYLFVLFLIAITGLGPGFSVLAFGQENAKGSEFYHATKIGHNFPYNFSPSLYKSLTSNDLLQLMDQANNTKNEYAIDKVLLANCMLGEYHLIKGIYKIANAYFDKALDISKQDIEKVPLMVKKAECAIGLEDYLSALEIIRQVNTMNPKQASFIVNTELMEVYCYAHLKSYDVALGKLNNLIEKKSDTSNFVAATILSFKGFIYQSKQQFPKALANYYESNQYLLNDSINLTSLFNLLNLGKIYIYQNKYDKGIAYFERAYQAAQFFGNENIQARILLEMGDAELHRNNYAMTAKYFQSALNSFQRLDNKYGVFRAKLKQLQYFSKINAPDSANYFYKSLEKEGAVFPHHQVESKTIFAEYYFKNGKFDKAATLIIEAIKLLNEYDLIQKEKLYRTLSEIQFAANDYKAAYLNLNSATLFRDSLNKKLSSKETDILEKNLENQFHQSVINQLQQENIQQNNTISKNIKQLKRQESRLQLTVIILLLSIVLLVLLMVWVHTYIKANRKLVLTNKTIAQQKEEIEIQSQHLVKVNEELDKLSVIARQTDNGIKILNATGRITWINEGYTKMFGFSLDELQSLNGHNLIGEEANININELVNAWYGDKKPISFESLNKTKKGDEIWTQTTITPILADDGRIDHMVAIEADITKLKTAEREITVKNEDITASISYAKRIQEAMFTPFDIVQKLYPKSFYFQKPKSIVSGDFYWTIQKRNKLVVVCADCTGHGVPGAFMSLLGISFLNKIVNEKGYTSPDVILNRLRLNVINNLNQKAGSNAAGDGMDVSVVCIDLTTKQMQYAGAMNPAYLYRNKEFIELKADRMPVGYFDDEERPFTSKIVKIEKGDQLFLFTDGYHDQFGGNSSAKLKSTRFKAILEKTAAANYEKRKDIIYQEFNNWKGACPQVDDVLVMGIEIDK